MSQISEALRSEATGCRLKFTWMGVSRQLTAQQKQEAAQVFHADPTQMGASKKILDTRHDAWKALAKVKSGCREYWQGCTLPWIDDGVRLLRQQQVGAFNSKMEEFRSELVTSVNALESNYLGMRSLARDRLGELWNSQDYPESLIPLFGMEWDFPPFEPDERLCALAPAVYEQQKALVAARFEEAVALGEQMFAEEFAKLVSHLSERLTDGAEGRKVFRDTAITNLTDFFERFKTLSVRSNPELDRLVEQAKSLVSGTSPKELRALPEVRTGMAQQMTQIAAALDAQIITAPTRRIRFAPNPEVNHV